MKRKKTYYFACVWNTGEIAIEEVEAKTKEEVYKYAFGRCGQFFLIDGKFADLPVPDNVIIGKGKLFGLLKKAYILGYRYVGFTVAQEYYTTYCNIVSIEEILRTGSMAHNLRHGNTWKSFPKEVRDKTIFYRQLYKL